MYDDCPIGTPQAPVAQAAAATPAAQADPVPRRAEPGRGKVQLQAPRGEAWMESDGQPG